MRKPRMTRQHFELVASAVNDALRYLQGEASWLESDSERAVARQAAYFVALALAKKLSETNPQFSYRRFLDACGFDK